MPKYNEMKLSPDRGAHYK